MLATNKTLTCHIRIVLVAIAVFQAEIRSAESRVWKDASGKFNVEAEFVLLQNGIVHLKRADGKVSKVPIQRLSQADQAFARKQHAKQRKAKKATSKKTQETLLGTLGDLEKVEADGFEIVVKKMSDSSFPVYPGLRISKNLRYVNLQLSVERNGDVPAEFSLERLSLVSPDKNKRFGVWGYETQIGGGRELIHKTKKRSKTGVGVTLIFNRKGDDRSANIWFQLPKRGAEPAAYQVFLASAPRKKSKR